MKKITSILFIVLLVIGCSDIDSIKSPRKYINKTENIIFTEGRWEATSPTKPGIISKINFTSITCDINNMECTEMESLLFTPKEQTFLKESTLYNQIFVYQIIDWSNDTIKAKRETPVADIEIIISLKDNYAEKSFRETKARGSNSANSEVSGKWILK